MNAANLTIRVNRHLVRRLEVRALAHGRSVTAEHRAILEAALRPALSGSELWQKLSCSGCPEIDLETGVDQTIPPFDFD